MSTLPTKCLYASQPMKKQRTVWTVVKPGGQRTPIIIRKGRTWGPKASQLRIKPCIIKRLKWSSDLAYLRNILRAGSNPKETTKIIQGIRNHLKRWGIFSVWVWQNRIGESKPSWLNAGNPKLRATPLELGVLNQMYIWTVYFIVYKLYL